MINNKFVMFLDVLGFSSLVVNNNQEQLRKIYDSEFIQSVKMSPVLTASEFGLEEDFKLTVKASGEFHDLQQNFINLHAMSDTVIAWTDDTSLESFIKICYFSATYLSLSLSLGLPHRGAISVGDIQLISLPLNGENKPNVVGSGIVKAHNLEMAQEWMGCAVDTDCLKEFSQPEIHNLFLMEKCPVVKYSPPYKNEAKYKTDLSINWTLFQPSIKNKDYFIENFTRHNKGFGGTASTKVNHTYDFYEECNPIK